MEQETVTLIRKAQAGDTEAFHRLVSLYDNQVMSLAIRVLQNEQDAEDLYQEVFMKVFMNIRKFRFESDFFTWLYRITMNSAFNFKKRMRKHYYVEKGTEQDETGLDWIPDPDASRGNSPRELQTAVMKAVDTLPQKQRTVFVLKHLENLKIKDIASILGCAEGTVKKYLFRAMEKLRADLEEYRYA